MVLGKRWPSACWHTLLEVSLGTTSPLVVCTETCHGSRRKRLTAQLRCKNCWKEPSAHWSLASSIVSLQQAPRAAFFPHAASTLIKLLYLAPGRFSFSFMRFFFYYFFLIFWKQNCTGSVGKVLTWQSWNCSFLHGASLACSTEVPCYRHTDYMNYWWSDCYLFEKQHTVYTLVPTYYLSVFPLEKCPGSWFPVQLIHTTGKRLDGPCLKTCSPTWMSRKIIAVWGQLSKACLSLQNFFTVFLPYVN